MDDMIPGMALFAMHPAWLVAMMERGSLESMLPEGLRRLAGLAGGQEARASVDPIREGATVIVPVKGMLGPRGLGWPRTETDVLADRVRDFAADSKVGAIVLDVQSPGGFVFGLQEAGDAIFEARQAKPVVAVANQFAFSAAHWLATQAGAFYATPSGEVGSVGVRAGHVDQSGFEEKIGMRTTLVASHPDKIMAHPYAPLSDSDLEALQAGVDEANEMFVAAIARGRGMAPGDVAGVHGTGRTFSARRAAASGAIDGVMTLRDVVAKYSSSRSRLSLMKRQAAVMEQLAAI